MTKHVGILGYPLAHSVSPIFQQAALDYLHLDVRYSAWETEPSKLQERVEYLRSSEVLGANVTIPHKENVMDLLDDLDTTGRDVGSINTIVNRGGRLIGYNTDAPGFMRGLREDGGFEAVGKRVAMMGAGGAARAVAYGLVKAGVTSLVIVNRTIERAEALAACLIRSSKGVGIEVRSALDEATEYDLLVNCTSIGMRHGAMEGRLPLPAEVIRSETLVCDLVYNPMETPLLLEAKKRGAKALDGLPMLIYQGALAFQKWTGERAPTDVMFESAKEALN